MELLEIQKDHKAFEEQLNSLLRTHSGKYALVKDCRIIEFYDTRDAAYSAGLTKFGLDETFYIGKVEKQVPQPVSYAWIGGVMFGQQREEEKA